MNMKIGIISDIHGYPDKFKKAITYFDGCDIILCAGDVLYHGPRNPILDGYNPKGLVDEIKNCKIPMLIARGNCDAEVDSMVLEMPILTEYLVYEKDDTRIIVMHGHKDDLERQKQIAKAYNAQVIISGHTHIRVNEDIEGVKYINPGSVSVPKGDKVPSVAIYEDNIVTFINVETGDRI